MLFPFIQPDCYDRLIVEPKRNEYRRTIVRREVAVIAGLKIHQIYGVSFGIKEGQLWTVETFRKRARFIYDSGRVFCYAGFPETRRRKLFTSFHSKGQLYFRLRAERPRQTVDGRRIDCLWPAIYLAVLRDFAHCSLIGQFYALFVLPVCRQNGYKINISDH